MASNIDPPLRLVVFWILLFGFCVRAQTLRTPLFDHHNWRQADTAQIARNFWRERFNPFFPQVDQRGAQERGYVETGFELYAFVVASVARVVGFHVEIGRALNCVLFVVSGATLFGFLARRYDIRTAAIGLFTYAFGLPLSLFLDRAVINEPLLVCLSLVCLASAQAFVRSRSWPAAMTLIVASALIGMIKFPYLIIWAPVFGLFLEADGRRVLREWPLYAMVAVDLIAAGLWYSHAHRLAATTGLSFGMLDKTFDSRLVFSIDFYAAILERLVKDILGPVGVAAATIGFIVAVRRRRWPELLGAAGFLAYLLLVARGNRAHDYYQIAIVPVAIMLIAVGVDTAVRPLTERMYPAGVTVVLGLMLLSTLVRSVSFHSWYEYDPDRPLLCRELRPQLQPRELVAFVDYPSPDLLFCLDRHGWLFGEGEWSSDDLLEAWKQGASVLVVNDAASTGALPDGIRHHATLMTRTGHLTAYRLDAP